MSDDRVTKTADAAAPPWQRADAPRPSRAPGGEPDPRLKAACEDLESLFIHHMLSAMRKTVEKSGLIDGGRGEEIYTTLMDAELAKSMAAAGGLGLSAFLHAQLAGPDPAPAADRAEQRFNPGGHGKPSAER